MSRINLKGMTLRELKEFAESIGEERFRGKQLFDWLYNKRVASYSEMTPLAKSLRKKLSTVAAIDSLQLVTAQKSQVDATTKFLFELKDGRQIESVLIPPRTAFASLEARNDEEQKRLTLCVSTQVGCPLDCKFCATATMGFARNLTAGEIVDQVIQVDRIANKRITNVVYMGMGEPLMNYDEVMKSIEILIDGLNIAARRITVSTVGWASKIRQLAEENRKVKLAVSLHTLDERDRLALMPVTKKFPLDDLIDAVKYYCSKVKRRVTFEYILFEGWNDRDEDVRRLVKLSKQVPCKINIIPFHSIGFTNPTGISAQLHPASKEKVEIFANVLRRAHLTVFVRSSAGEDIDAACGQLAIRTDPQRIARRATRYLMGESDFPQPTPHVLTDRRRAIDTPASPSA